MEDNVCEEMDGKGGVGGRWDGEQEIRISSKYNVYWDRIMAYVRYIPSLRCTASFQIGGNGEAKYQRDRKKNLRDYI
jgi:hypothetical protein